MKYGANPSKNEGKCRQVKIFVYSANELASKGLNFFF